MTRRHGHESLKSALIAAALDLLDAHGSDAITIRAVARMAGVSHAAPVNHFADRRALLTAVAVQCFDELQALVDRAMSDHHADARAQLYAMTEAFCTYGLSKPGRYRLMWRRDMLDASDPALNAHTDILFALVGQVAEQFGEPADISLMSRVVAICSAIHGYVMLRIDGNFEGYVDEKTDQPRHRALIDALLPR